MIGVNIGDQLQKRITRSSIKEMGKIGHSKGFKMGEFAMG